MPSRTPSLRSPLVTRSLLAALVVGVPLACSSQSSDPTGATPGPSGTGTMSAMPSGSMSAMPSGSMSAMPSGSTPPPVLQPGEVCDASNVITISFSPSSVHLAPNQTRDVIVSAVPDQCQPGAITLSFDSAQAATVSAVGGAAPAAGDGQQSVTLDLDHPSAPVSIRGLSAGAVTLTASMVIGAKTFTTKLPVAVEDPALPACTGTVTGMVTPGGALGGTTDAAGASMGLPAGADMPAQATEGGVTYASPVLWSVNGFAGSVSCAADIVPAGFVPLGPAVTFGPESMTFPREIPMAVPINLAAMPDKARMRHLRVSYSGPAFTAPRTVPVADPHVEALTAGGYVLRFLAPRLGTYQAVIAPDAGTHTEKRRLTHRAVMGVSMGGGGSSMLGLKHHDKFDVIAPLGGPLDWTYMLDQIERNHVGGFLANDGVTVPDKLAPMPKPLFPYEHPSQYNHWWYEFPKGGNGGTFDRGAYVNIFSDLALQFGNPNSQNLTPDGEHLAAGLDFTQKAVVGDHPGHQCAVPVDPITGDPGEAMQHDIADHCGAERCAHPQKFANYFDGKFNPKGTFSVISVCDGGPQDKTQSPYADIFQDDPKTRDVPFSVALAVDYNGNGVRDANEPLLRQGHEPFRDVGSDGLADADEPGYMPGVNDDPSGDNYDPQYNPNGTENNARWDMNEPFDDVGLDGVKGTASSPYDFGEGDGKFTAAAGLMNMWNQDTRSVIHQWVTPPGGPFDDKALHRLDMWSDGGMRDLFNFEVSAQHLVGSFASRGRDAAYFTDPSRLPGQAPGDPSAFAGELMHWDEMPGSVLVRYGQIDPTVPDLASGSGQHVGTADEILARLEGAFFFAGSRWPDAPRRQVEKTQHAPVAGATPCEIMGNCTFPFTDSRGRTGPVTVNLPPGYAHKDLQGVAYPVIYVMHGYGQSPQDLGAAVILLSGWMNSATQSSVTRMPRAIVVYVDGRCRVDGNGNPECLRGSFYADSPRATGGKLESWFLELMQEIDKKYRTMGETEVDWTD